MDLSNGLHQVCSPSFNGYHEGREWRTLTDRAQRPLNLRDYRITRVGLKVYKVGKLQIYHGLRLYAGEETIVDEHWYTKGEWEYQDIPADRRIVGIYGSIQNEMFIHQLGLIIM